MNVTIYLSRFDTDDLFNRLLHLVQMLASVAFAVSIAEAVEDKEARSLFTLAFCIIRTTLFIGYMVNFIVLPSARRFCLLHAFFNLVSVAFWATSVLIEFPYFLVNWWLSYVADLFLFFITAREAKRASIILQE